jgi:hypothetical protein
MKRIQTVAFLLSLFTITGAFSRSSDENYISAGDASRKINDADVCAAVERGSLTDNIFITFVRYISRRLLGF